MSEHHFLLIIDKTPPTKDLIEYFRKYNIQIVQQQSLHLQQNEENMPVAILIDCSVLKKEAKVMNEFYKNYPVPLFITSDLSAEDCCIEMLEAGADDWMTKPLSPRELHARIAAISRRINRNEKRETKGKEVLLFANWRLYPASRQIFDQNKKELKLSSGEYDLLLIFLKQPHKILDREFLLQVTKNIDHNPFDRRVDIQISRLRQKIETDIKKTSLIKTIRNRGYMFTGQISTIRE